MSREIILQGQFKRDLKKRFLDLATAEWSEVLNCLANDLPLAEKYCDHPLVNDIVNKLQNNKTKHYQNY